MLGFITTLLFHQTFAYLTIVCGTLLSKEPIPPLSLVCPNANGTQNGLYDCQPDFIFYQWSLCEQSMLGLMIQIQQLFFSELPWRKKKRKKNTDGIENVKAYF